METRQFHKNVHNAKMFLCLLEVVFQAIRKGIFLKNCDENMFSGHMTDVKSNMLILHCTITSK